MRGTAAGQAATRTRASVLRPAADRAVDMLGVGLKVLLAQLEVADGVGSGRDAGHAVYELGLFVPKSVTLKGAASRQRASQRVSR
jgi:hypothetical protein